MLRGTYLYTMEAMKAKIIANTALVLRTTTVACIPLDTVDKSLALSRV